MKCRGYRAWRSRDRIRKCPPVILVPQHALEFPKSHHSRFARLVLSGAIGIRAHPPRVTMANKISTKTVVGILLMTSALVAVLIASRLVCGGRPRADESAAAGSLRTLYSANIAYAKSHPEVGYAKKRNDFPSRSDEPGQHNDPEWAIDPSILGRVKSGYIFSYTPVSSKGDGKIDAYSVSADPFGPGKTRKRHFFMDETGVIRVSETGPATASDPVVQ
jgi:hypothetical protein